MKNHPVAFSARAYRRLAGREACCSGVVNHGQDYGLDHDAKMLIKHGRKDMSVDYQPVSICKQPFSITSIRTLGVSNQQEIPIGGNSDER